MKRTLKYLFQRCLRKPNASDREKPRREDIGSNDPYGILGLTAHPDPNQINSSFRELSRRYATDPQAFRKISSAYLELCRRQGAYY